MHACLSSVSAHLPLLWFNMNSDKQLQTYDK